jgi:osmoprotectant transport system substrate-binding protein
MDRTKAVTLSLIGIALALTPACRQNRNLTVGSKNFTEQVILGEIVAQHLERRLDKKVDRALNLGGTIVVHSAIMGGSIDVYPEYSYTALSAILKMNMINNDAQGILERVREVYNQTYRLDVLPPLGFNNSFVMAVAKSTADKYKLTTISDAEKVEDTWVLGVGYEFEQRPDGLPALNEKYDVQTRGAPVTMDLGLLYKALEQRQVNMVAGSATDAQLMGAPVKVLKDDRGAFGPYQALLVVSQDSEKKHPGLKAALLELSGKISDEEMRRMNYEVDIQKVPPAKVAAAFLTKLQ